MLILVNQEGESEAPAAAVAVEDLQTDGRFLGAPVDFVVYSDFQCPFCKQFDDEDLPQVVNTFVESGEVRVKWRPMPIISQEALDSEENESVQAAEAATCAADQNQFWQYSDALFAAQGAESSSVYTTGMLRQTAADLGLDTEAFNECLDAGEKEDEVIALRDEAVQIGVSGTPTFLINDQLVSYTREGFDRLEDQLNQALDGELIEELRRGAAMATQRYLLASLALGLIGTAIGAYLVWGHYDLDALVCGTGECEIVQTSSYATMLGIPITWLGLAMYLAVTALALLRLRLPQMELSMITAALTITGAGTLYSGWLTYLELYVIDAICQWCVASAIVTTLLFINEVLSFCRLWADEDHAEYLEDADFA